MCRARESKCVCTEAYLRTRLLSVFTFWIRGKVTMGGTKQGILSVGELPDMFIVHIIYSFEVNYYESSEIEFNST